MGGIESQGISSAGQTVLAKLMESKIWHLSASSMALWVQKRGNGLCPPFCLGESCPPALTLTPDTSVPPPMSLVPFKLLPQCWSSEGVSLSKSMCMMFKRNCLVLQNFLPPNQCLLGFADRSCGDLPSWHWNLELGDLVCGWDSSLLRCPSRIFIHHTWMWDQSILHLYPSYQSGWMWFL